MQEIKIINKVDKNITIDNQYSLSEFFKKFGDRLDILILESTDNIVFDSCFKIKDSSLRHDGGLYLNLNVNTEDDICIYDKENMFISIITSKDTEVAKFYIKSIENYCIEIASIILN